MTAPMTGVTSMAMGLSVFDKLFSLKYIKKKLKERKAQADKIWNRKSISNIHSAKMTKKQVERFLKGTGQL